jgi:hypothetical protein
MEGVLNLSQVKDIEGVNGFQLSFSQLKVVATKENRFYPFNSPR